MRKKLFIRFFKLLIGIVPANILIAISALYLNSGWLNDMLEWAAGILNFPMILLILNYRSVFLNSIDANWYIAASLLTIVDSVLWAFLIALIWTTSVKTKEPSY